MKKPKLRLDKAAIQEFFIQNAEKIVFGLLALVFVFFVYSVTGVDRCKRTPEELNTKVREGQALVDGTPPIVKDMVVKDYDVQAKQNTVPVDERLYPSLAVIDPPILSKPQLRVKPDLYAVAGLRGSAGFVAMSMITDPPAGGGVVNQGAMTVQGLRWIVLTGLVPYDMELRAFGDALRNAGPNGCYSPDRDSPYYLGYDVQRLEVLSPADAAKPNWDNAKSINSLKAITEMQQRWGQQQVREEHVSRSICSRQGRPPLCSPWET